MSNESWVDVNGNIVVEKSLWMPGQPNGGDLQTCSSYNTTLGKYYDTSCSFKSCFICSWKFPPLFRLRGLCTKTQIDNQYILRPSLEFDKNIFFYGVEPNNIIFDEARHSWLIVKDTAVDLIGDGKRPKQIVGTFWQEDSDTGDVPVGTQAWNLTDRCNNLSQLKLTSVSLKQDIAYLLIFSKKNGVKISKSRSFFVYITKKGQEYLF